MKAKICVALRAKQVGCKPKGWETMGGDYGKKGSCSSGHDIVDEAGLARVRSYKMQKKAAAKAAATKS